MDTVNRADPHLMAIRGVIETVKTQGSLAVSSQMEKSRYKLYLALQSGKFQEARNWLNALEAFVEIADSDAYEKALDGISEILKDVK